MKVYHLKVSLFGYHEQPINKLHRIIEISENSTFEALHEAIFEAFDRFDPHLYTFFITKKDIKGMHDIMDAPEITNPYSFNEDMLFDSKPKNTVTTKLKDAKLKEKDVFHYWFDFGDDWWHRIRVEKITSNNRIKKDFVRITKKVGESPAQYNYDDDGDFDEEGFDEVDFDLIDFNNIDVNQLDFAMMDIDEAKLASIGFSEEDLLNLMQAIQENKSKAIMTLIDKYGVDNLITIFQTVGIPESETKLLRNMLNTFPIINFLEAIEDPNMTLTQEHGLLKQLIKDLQLRLSDLEKSIAEDTNQSYK
ncbi:plasmid pRiA4b ORF-3 family protein [Psychrobacter lutiphocae]|uniref:plasmid pRiA4b ORF-3 family protein n=1 Tax=Psychrobacter lutiphocae TaxID=540500 RepID=UPI00037E6BFF|nr:plasmid pRiA4b ORF-3 family protein [Psychrobacter lutiphocae]